VLATSSPFTVTAVSVTESPSPVARTASLTATWSGIGTPSARNWIGLYASSSATDNAWVNYRYLNGSASGSVPIPIPANATPGATYQLRLFAANSYNVLATSSPFTVTAVSVTESPSPVARTASLTATWSGIGTPSARNWIGLYASSSATDNAWVNYRYLNG